MPAAIALEDTTTLNLDGAMTKSARPADAIESANASFWKPVPLDEFLRDVDQIDSVDEFAIDDLTNNEWEAFWSAISE
jgi:hypothetical protein